MRLRKVATLFLILVITGCSADFGAIKGIEVLFGAMVGGSSGSERGNGNGRLLAVGMEDLFRPFTGSGIGRALDDTDKRYAQEAYEKAIEASRTGEVTSWENSGSGNSGTYTPTVSYRTAQGQYCRAFMQSISAGAATQDSSGTACRNQNGIWELVSK